MRKTYQLKTNAIKGEQQVIDVTPAMGKTPVKVPAAAGARYELIDSATKAAPDNIRAMRKGKNLQIFFDGDTEPGAVIENFYQAHTDNLPTLVGRTEQGVLYEYIPESAAPSAVVSQLGDTGNAYGMALGGQELAASGAAVGLLAAPLVAGFSPLLLGAGVLGAAALAGGGGGSSGSGTTTLSNSNAKVLIASISEDTGSSSADFYTADNSLNYSGKITGFTSNGDQVKVELKDKTGAVIATGLVTPDANGDWSWKDDSNTRVDGNYTLVATIVDKNGNRVNTGADGSSSQIITIDTSATQNTDPSNPSNAAADDPNRNATLTIKSIDDSNASTDKINGSKDTGISDKDFYTADNTLMYFGTVTKFTANGDALKLELKDKSGTVISTGYATPSVDANGNGTWSWSDTANERPDGNYTLVATIVDKAGNPVSGGTSQIITIDTKPDKNTDPSNPANSPASDPNSSTTLSINTIDDGLSGTSRSNGSKDTGVSNQDFYTADNTLSYFGKVKGFTANGDQIKLELKDSYGKIIRTDYLTPDADGNWSWNDQNSPRADGNYTLQASIVDKAGNLVYSGTSKIVTIDTSSSLNTDPSDPAKQPASDPNSKFVLDISGMQNDSGVQGDWITNGTKPVFSGSFGSYAFDSTQGQISFQLLDSTGKLISSASPALADDNKSWSTSEPDSDLKDGVYYSRVLITDKAGNIVSTDFQKFIIDTKLDVLKAGNSYDSKNKISLFSFDINESAYYELYTVDTQKNLTKIANSDGRYQGSQLDITTATTTYGKEGFAVKISDASGNSITYYNSYQIENSSAIQKISFSNNSINATDPNKAGTVDSYLLTETTPFDLSQLVFEQPQTGASLIHNEISMTGNGVQQLALRLNDVLNLGATNSFDTGTYKDDVQMRIKGDAQDKVTLLDSAVWTQAGTSVTLDDNIQYQVLTANNGTVDLFVQSGVQIYKSDGTSFMV